VHNLHRYHTLSGHSYLSRGIYCNRAAYDSWPEPVQQAIREATRAAILVQRQLAVEEEDVARDAIVAAGGEIVTLTVNERAAFVDAVRSLHEAARRRFPQAFALLKDSS
jgi:TRAP-type C4-dicarboxylate transport system substrate-binding protein